MKTEWPAYGVPVVWMDGVQFWVVCSFEIYFILGLSLMLMDATKKNVFHFCVIIVTPTHGFDPIYVNQRN